MSRKGIEIIYNMMVLMQIKSFQKEQQGIRIYDTLEFFSSFLLLLHPFIVIIILENNFTHFLN